MKVLKKYWHYTISHGFNRNRSLGYIHSSFTSIEDAHNYLYIQFVSLFVLCLSVSLSLFNGGVVSMGVSGWYVASFCSYIKQHY